MDFELNKGVIICDSDAFHPAEQRKLENAGYVVVHKKMQREVRVIKDPTWSPAVAAQRVELE